MLQVAAIAEFGHDAKGLALNKRVVKLDNVFVVQLSQQVSFTLRFVFRVFAVRGFASWANIDDFYYKTFFFRIN